MAGQAILNLWVWCIAKTWEAGAGVFTGTLLLITLHDIMELWKKAKTAGR